MGSVTFLMSNPYAMRMRRDVQVVITHLNGDAITHKMDMEIGTLMSQGTYHDAQLYRLLSQCIHSHTTHNAFMMRSYAFLCRNTFMPAPLVTEWKKVIS